VFAGDLSKQPAYAEVEYRKVGELPMTKRVMNDSFWIGVWPGLNQAQIDYMIEALVAATKEATS
jgi:CDP-6-deoxy-D-xylo-4-hexulose-3-dehydrase